MKRILPILIALLVVDSSQAQSLWRNFFTTNRDPIVEVVAGSNATVQATTVGSNLRRFTVNSTATGGTNSLVQTNISYVAVTNAPWQFGDSDLTNWATLNTNVLSTLGQTNISYTAVTNSPWQYGSANLTNWNQLGTNVLSTLGQTNISYTAVTNAPWQTGSANLTNFSALSTNTFVNKAGDTVSGPILTTSSTSNSPSATELATADWVRGLFNAGADYYNTTNIDSVATNVSSGQPVYKFQSTIPISDARTYTTANFLTNGGYVGSVITTNTFSQISGAALVTAYLGFTGGGGGPTLTLHPEIYYSYDKTNWYGDWSGNDESIASGTTNVYQWAISIPVTTSTNANGFYVIRRFKVGSVTGTGTRTLTVLIGTNAVSGISTAGHITMESPNATAGNAFLANNQVFTGSNYFTQPLTLSLATNTPSAGQVLTATSASDAAWQIPSSGGGISSICNAQSISMPDSGPRYAAISGAGAVYSIIGPVNVPVSFLASSATLGPFAVSFNSAYASGTNVTFTLMTNSVATHIAITINGGSTIGYSTGTVSITNGTPVAIKITSTLASAHTQSYWMFSVGLK